MMSLLKISVIIPAYRAAPTIRRALDSVLLQTTAASEIIVVNDGADDELTRLVISYPGPIRLLQQPHGGAARARNRGLDAARGDLVAFLDADDYWEPHKLQSHVALYERYSKLGLSCSRFYQQQPGGGRSPAAMKTAPAYDQLLRPEGSAIFRLATQVWTGTVVVPRRVLADHRFRPGLEPAEDRDLWVRLIAAAPVYYLSQPLATAVLEEASLSRGDADRDAANMLRVVHAHGDLLQASGVRHWEAYVFRRWAAAHLGQQHYDRALQPALARCYRQPWSAEAWWIMAKCLAGAARMQVRPRGFRQHG